MTDDKDLEVTMTLGQLALFVKYIQEEEQPKREWVGLTDMEIEDIYEQEGCADIVLLTEAKLKEKNT